MVVDTNLNIKKYKIKEVNNKQQQQSHSHKKKRKSVMHVNCTHITRAIHYLFVKDKEKKDKDRYLNPGNKMGIVHLQHIHACATRDRCTCHSTVSPFLAKTIKLAPSSEPRKHNLFFNNNHVHQHQEKEAGKAGERKQKRNED